MIIPYTEKEQRYLNKRVESLYDVGYTSTLTVRAGSKGTIVDYGRSSNDPIVDWDNYTQKTSIPWNWIKIEGENDNATSENPEGTASERENNSGSETGERKEPIMD